jgi:hypothetical protein
MVSIMLRSTPALLLLALAAPACKSEAHAPEATKTEALSYPCKRMVLGDPQPTEYDCPDSVSAQICQEQSVINCRPMNRARGTVAPGGSCRRGTWEAAAKAFELGDNCAPIPQFAGEDTPKGSICVKEAETAGAYCTHNCKVHEDCADVVRAGFTSDCRGGGCFLISKEHGG